MLAASCFCSAEYFAAFSLLRPTAAVDDSLSEEDEEMDFERRLLRVACAVSRLGLGSTFRLACSPRPFRYLLGLVAGLVLLRARAGLSLRPRRDRGLLTGGGNGDGLRETLGDMVNRDGDRRFLLAAVDRGCLGLLPRLPPGAAEAMGDLLSLRFLRTDRDLDRDRLLRERDRLLR